MTTVGYGDMVPKVRLKAGDRKLILTLETKFFNMQKNLDLFLIWSPNFGQ